MAGKADVQTHLNNRRTALGSLFAEWSDLGLAPSDRADIIKRYLDAGDFGEVLRVGAGNSLSCGPATVDPNRPNVLVLGRHHVEDLVADDELIPDASIIGPGVATRLGPTVAFAEGARAAHALVGEQPVNLNLASLGDGDGFDTISSILPDRPLDAIYITTATSWSPHHPTLTIGARGELVVKLTLDAGAPIDDFLTSGALRNPLTKMVQLLGSLRDTNGRIALPGFYERAHPPDSALRTAMYAHEHDPNAWADRLMAARPEGGLSSLERATMWPGVSVLDIDTVTSAQTAAPAAVTATVAFYLIPDQRPVEVEQSIREWFLAATPDDLRPSISVQSSKRPWRCDPGTKPLAAQMLAALRIYGRRPILVPAGGAAGAGEIAFALDAPVTFAGIAPPSRSFGSQRESLSWSHFDAAVELAAETCLQLRRP